MAEPKRPALKLVDADENYTPPTNLDELPQTERAAAFRNVAYAQAIKEGRRRERAETIRAMGGWALEQLKARKLNQDQHEAEIERLTKERGHWVLDGKWHGRWQGLAMGLILGLFASAASGWAVWAVSSDMRAQIVAQQRTLAPHETWQPPTTHERQGFQ